MRRRLSKRELRNISVTRHPLGPNSSGLVELDGFTWDRIWATLEDGFAPDEPTPYQLDKWAAEKIMGWSASAATWVKLTDSLAKFHHVIDQRGWKPSVNLGQALECAKATGTRVPFELLASGAAVIGISTSGGKTHYFEFDEYDEAKIAEAIVRKLHAELAS